MILRQDRVRYATTVGLWRASTNSPPPSPRPPDTTGDWQLVSSFVVDRSSTHPRKHYEEFLLLHGIQQFYWFWEWRMRTKPCVGCGALAVKDNKCLGCGLSPS